MSYPDQGPPGRNVAQPGQPMQQAPANWPQHGHLAQPPTYGAAPPPYGTPAPAYGTAAPGGYRAGRRPGVVTAAAVIAFVFGGAVILTNLFFLLFLLAISHDATDTWRVWEVVLVVVRLALGALFIWGGIAALKGRTRRILLVVSAIEAIFSLLLAVGIVIPFFGILIAEVGILDLMFVGPILILILQPSSWDFFRARGEATNKNKNKP
jgi:uncharacterized membrane protein YsdA (DUF1294 family)